MKKTTRYSFRKLINDIHLWLGLASGIILFLVCISGTILTFYHEIKDFFADDFSIEKTANKETVSALVTTLKVAEIGFVAGVTIAADPKKPYVFNVKKNLKERRGSRVLVNPFSSEIITLKKTSADAFLATTFKLHRWLLLDAKIGRPIVGVATIIFLIISFSGIYLWFPKKLKWRNIKQGFKIKTKANWKRINYDLHNTLGFYTCIFIIIMGITGLCWSFEGYKDGLGNLIGTQIFNRSSPEFLIENTPSNKVISVDEAILIANKTLDYKGDLSVTFPSEKKNYYRFSKTNDANFSPVTSDLLFVAQYGEVLAVDYFKDNPLNVQFASLIKPIHTGEIYGLFSKIIYFFVCLIATSLPVTGTIIWINKLKKSKKEKV
ncbi:MULTISPECIES: PepSY-associated TM helix domain-containing protein [unclassified Polaribacter]|uniref:PepSY-associated TM helix domain-containing protein n=1 Tax=unclassified Polaribacter TaxID=196858 RepID=UPI00197B8FBD|nr:MULTISPECIES: PepSY-associated TM helix domain-containing protein [unclassified Polaribacter]